MRTLLTTLSFIICISINAQNDFIAAYNQYPIPKGILESIGYTKTHLTENSEKIHSCNGMPVYYGKMGVIDDGKDYFKNTAQMISEISGYSLEDIIMNNQKQITAYTKSLWILSGKSKNIEDYIEPINQLNELVENTPVQKYAKDSELYSILKLLNNSYFMNRFGYTTHNINLKKIFGNNINILSSKKVMIENSYIYNGTGDLYKSSCSDYPNSNWIASPNFNSRNGTPITDVTIHTIQGSYAGCISWFQNPNAQVSAHYVIRSSDGQITQMVCESDRGWHVGSENDYTIGIEHEGFVNDPTWLTDSMYISSVNLVKDIVSSGYDVDPKSCYMNNFQGIINSCYHIKGHVHFPNQSHTDPGPFWDWKKYYDLINDQMMVVLDTNCNGTFTDSGGVIGTYESFQSYMTVISPTNTDSLVLTFNTFDLELGYDTMSIYDGTDTSGILIGSYTGTNSPGTVIGTSGSLAIVFYSDCLNNETGWDANWNCYSLSVGLNEEKLQKKVIKITNILGKTITPLKNTILLYHYKDGTIEKKIIIE